MQPEHKEYTGSAYIRAELIGLLASLYYCNGDEHTLKAAALALRIDWAEVLSIVREMDKEALPCGPAS